MNNNKNIDSYVDDLKRALGYSSIIMIAMWIISIFVK